MELGDKTEIPVIELLGEVLMNCKKTDKDALDILKEASKNPMYKSTTDQGKAINLFNSILDTVARDKQDIARYDLIWQKLIRSKTLKTCKSC
jgi:endothelin-converting enzyme/putative endopeptidase